MKSPFKVPGLDGPERGPAAHPAVDPTSGDPSLFSRFRSGFSPDEDDDQDEGQDLTETEVRAIEGMAREVLAQVLARFGPGARAEFEAFWDSPLSADAKMWVVDHASWLAYVRYGLWAWAFWEWWQRRKSAAATASVAVAANEGQ